MLTYYAEKPSKVCFTKLPDRMLLVVFNDDIKKVETESTETGEQWTTEQYTLTLPDLPGMQSAIQNNCEAWLAKAKQKPVPEVPDRQRLNELEEAVLELASIVGGE